VVVERLEQADLVLMAQLILVEELVVVKVVFRFQTVVLGDLV